MTFEAMWFSFLALLFVGLVVVCILRDRNKKKGGDNNGS